MLETKIYARIKKQTEKPPGKRLPYPVVNSHFGESIIHHLSCTIEIAKIHFF